MNFDALQSETPNSLLFSVKPGERMIERREVMEAPEGRLFTVTPDGRLVEQGKTGPIRIETVSRITVGGNEVAFVNAVKDAEANVLRVIAVPPAFVTSPAQAENSGYAIRERKLRAW